MVEESYEYVCTSCGYSISVDADNDAEIDRIEDMFHICTGCKEDICSSCLTNCQCCKDKKKEKEIEDTIKHNAKVIAKADFDYLVKARGGQ